MSRIDGCSSNPPQNFAPLHAPDRGAFCLFSASLSKIPLHSASERKKTSALERSTLQLDFSAALDFLQLSLDFSKEYGLLVVTL